MPAASLVSSPEIGCCARSAPGQLLAALSAGATSALLVVLARDHLDLAASGYGLLLGGIGVGSSVAWSHC